jgi:hypothetical protein
VQSGQVGEVWSHASMQAAWNARRHAGSSRSSASGMNGERPTIQSGELFDSAASVHALQNRGTDLGEMSGRCIGGLLLLPHCSSPPRAFSMEGSNSISHGAPASTGAAPAPRCSTTPTPST